MSNRLKRIIYAKLFFAIFFVKMMISTAPIFTHGFDKDALRQVVLQLEIENNNGKSGSGDQLKDIFAKDFTRSTSLFSLHPPINQDTDADVVIDDARHIQAFYPSVPTPPPNC